MLIGFNLTHHFNCEAWFRAVLVRYPRYLISLAHSIDLRLLPFRQVFSYFGIAFTSLLILLRGFVAFLSVTSNLVADEMQSGNLGEKPRCPCFYCSSLVY
jgi:hypothetical protein